MAERINIPESLFQEVWPLILQGTRTFRGTHDEVIEIVHPGTPNMDAGPDFLTAKVRINGTLWVGDIELHVNENAWKTHGHTNDPRYQQVILHAVLLPGKQAYNAKGERIVTLFPPQGMLICEGYAELATNNRIPACGDAISYLTPLEREEWLTRLVIERLSEKSDLAREEQKKSDLGWEEAFYRSLARSLGLKINAVPMEQLARITPLKALRKVADNPIAIEAMLLGQAGMIPGDPESVEDPSGYVRTLAQEYKHLRQLFNLTPMSGIEWLFMRVRPASSPALRIAQLASIVRHVHPLFGTLMQIDSPEDLRAAMQPTASNYWNNHYKLGGEASIIASPRTLGTDRLRIIILNSIIPFRFAYSAEYGDDELRERTMDLLEKLPPEMNRVVRLYMCDNYKPTSALHTQGLVQLHRKYCTHKLCHTCPIGLFHMITHVYPEKW